MRATVIGEPRVHRRDISMQQRIEAARPRLLDAERTELGDERRRLVQRQPPERPAGEVHVDVDRIMQSGLSCSVVQSRTPLASRIGLSSRFKFSPRMSRLVSSERSAPTTFASCDPKLRPGASLPNSTRLAPNSLTAISVNPAV